MSNTQTVTIKLALAGQQQVASGLTAVKNSVGSSLKGIVDSFGGPGAIFGAIAVAATATVVELRKVINSADGFNRLSQIAGTTAETMSSLGYAAKLSSVDIETLAKGMKGLGQWMKSTGQQGRDIDEVLSEQADLFARLPSGVQKSNLAIERFGKVGTELIPLLNNGSAGIKRSTDEARRFGLVVSNESAQAADDFNTNLTRMRGTLDGLANSTLPIILPALKQITNAFIAFRLSLPGDSALIAPFKGLLNFGAGQIKERFAEISAATNGLSAFVKTLAGGGGGKAAVEEAAKAAALALAQFDKAMEEMGQTTEKTTKDEEAFVAAIDFTSKRLKIAMESSKNSVASINGDTSLSPQQKRIALLRVYGEQLKIVADLQDDLSARTPSSAVLRGSGSEVQGTEEWLKAQEEGNRLMRERIEIMNEQAALGPDPNSFSGQIGTALNDIQDQWGTWAAQMAQSLKTVFGSAVTTISDNITGLILRTQTWGQALKNVGTGILTSIVHAIVGMAVQWIATQILMATVGKAILAGSVSASAPFAAASAAIWAAPATLATIATYGSAAAAAPAFIAGASAITTAQSVTQAGLAGFESGGYTGDGPTHQVAGAVHGREYVFDASSTSRIGVPNLEAMRRGEAMPSSGSGGGGQPVNIGFAFHDSRTDAVKWSKTQDFEARVIEVVSRNEYRMRRS